MMLTRLLRVLKVRCGRTLGAAMIWGLNHAGAAVIFSGASFHGVGDLPGGVFQSSVAALSPDGSIATGSSFTGPTTATMFTWTKTGGIIGHTADIRPHAINTGGSIIVGDGVVGFSVRAARWTSAGGVQLLEPSGGAGVVQSNAFAASADGTIIVGMRDDTDGDDSMSVRPGAQAFVWTAAGGVQLLGDLIGGRVESFAYGVSADGSVIAGYGTDGVGNKAFRWTSGGGMQSLGTISGIGESRANGISADGLTVVGWSSSAPGTQAFRWTSSGMIGLGDLPGGPFFSEARAVSGDGNAIVGYGYTVDGLGNNADRAFLWTPGHGMRDLKTVLQTDFGLNLTGWDLFDAKAISADGKTIAGVGRNPAGNFEGWVAVIPEPASVALIGLCGLLLRRGRRI